MTHLDLCSGIGGFALAAQWAGIETIGFAEIDEFCCRVLAKNFPDVKNYGDIKLDKDFPKADLITAGFPCQPFSQSGSKRGIDDERYLWPDVRHVIYTSAPRWIILENVCGVISLALDDILSDLARKDYSWHTFVLPACAANAPHRRDRVWVVAYHNSVRGYEWISSGESRHIQKNIDRYVAQVQQEWTQFKPDAWATYTARNWIGFNTRVRGSDDGVSRELDKSRIKALGNAIVPQVAYPFLKFIKMIHEDLK